MKQKFERQLRFSDTMKGLSLFVRQAFGDFRIFVLNFENETFGISFDMHSIPISKHYPSFKTNFAKNSTKWVELHGTIRRDHVVSSLFINKSSCQDSTKKVTIPKKDMSVSDLLNRFYDYVPLNPNKFSNLHALKLKRISLPHKKKSMIKFVHALSFATSVVELSLIDVFYPFDVSNHVALMLLIYLTQLKNIKVLDFSKNHLSQKDFHKVKALYSQYDSTVVFLYLGESTNENPKVNILQDLSILNNLMNAHGFSPFSVYCFPKVDPKKREGELQIKNYLHTFSSSHNINPSSLKIVMNNKDFTVNSLKYLAFRQVLRNKALKLDETLQKLPQELSWLFALWKGDFSTAELINYSPKDFLTQFKKTREERKKPVSKRKDPLNEMTQSFNIMNLS